MWNQREVGFPTTDDGTIVAAEIAAEVWGKMGDKGHISKDRSLLYQLYVEKLKALLLRKP